MGNDYEGAESMDSVLRAMQANLPGVIQAITAQQPYVARVQAETDAATSPIYAKSQVDLYNTYGRDLNRIGNEIETANQLAASGREKLISDTYGVDLVKAADQLNRILDPEFYTNRAEVGLGISKALGGQDPNRLTENELEAVSRGVARSGGNANPNNTVQAAANAMTFGQALQQKQQLYNQTLGTAAAALPTTRTGTNAFEIATRRSLTPNTGNNVFTGVQQNTGQNAWQTGNQFMNNATQLQNTKLAKQKDLLDQVVQGTQAFKNVVGSFSFA